MKKQNYLLAGLITILLIGVLSISGCVGDQVPSGTNGGDTFSAPTVPGTTTPGIPISGGTGDALPLVDVTSTTEFVARYPGSVMLYHSTLVLSEEGDYVTITYGTTDSADTVETWYRDMLENSGWEFAMDFSEEGNKSITYGKEDTQENVHITFGSLENEYTNIIVIYMKTK